MHHKTNRCLYKQANVKDRKSSTESDKVDNVEHIGSSQTATNLISRLSHVLHGLPSVHVTYSSIKMKGVKWLIGKHNTAQTVDIATYVNLKVIYTISTVYTHI